MAGLSRLFTLSWSKQSDHFVNFLFFFHLLTYEVVWALKASYSTSYQLTSSFPHGLSTVIINAVVVIMVLVVVLVEVIVTNNIIVASSIIIVSSSIIVVLTVIILLAMSPSSLSLSSLFSLSLTDFTQGKE